jgi:hypothetical protein
MVHPLGQVRSDGEGGSLELRATFYSSLTLFDLACKAYRQSKADPSQAIVALVFAAITIEAFLNDMVEVASSPLWEEQRPKEVEAFASVLSDLEQQRAQIGLKIQMAHYIFEGRQIDKGGLPYQSFDLLVKLRNALIHYKPEKLDEPSSEDGRFEAHRFVKRLAERGAIRWPKPGATPHWPAIISDPGVARWACNVAVQMIEYLVDLVPSSDLKKVLVLMTEKVEEVQ